MKCDRTVRDRAKVREKMLERELEKLAGANWQVSTHHTIDPPLLSATPHALCAH